MINAKILDFLPTFGAADDGHDSQKQNIGEFMLDFPLLARVTDDGEMVQEAESVHDDNLTLKII